MVRVAIGSDHAGFHLKETIKALLSGMGIPYEDVGAGTTDSSDYPDFAAGPPGSFSTAGPTAASSCAARASAW